MQFKITGKPRAFNFWNKLLQYAQQRVKRVEDKTVNVISATFPSAFCILIRYEIINNSQKYEIVLQGDYQDIYRIWKESDEPKIPESVNVELLIKSMHNSAKLVKAKKII